MKKVLTLITSLLLLNLSAQQVPEHMQYLGMERPGETAELFAPGIVSDGLSTRDIAIYPDGSEIYFCVSSDNFQFATILHCKFDGEKWSKPEVVPFATNPKYIYFEPCISPDGSKMMFLSNKPADGISDPTDEDIWCVDRVGDSWGEPYNLGAPINTDGEEYFPSLTNDMTLYFTRRAEDERSSSLYRSKFIDGKYTEAEKLPEQVNCGVDRFNCFVAPDESYVIVPSHIPGNVIGGIDYYIVFRNDDDTWQEPVNMSDKVNYPTGREYSAYVTRDGKYMFFMASHVMPDENYPEKYSYAFFKKLHDTPENGSTDVYWIDAGFISDLKASE